MAVRMNRLPPGARIASEETPPRRKRTRGTGPLTGRWRCRVAECDALIEGHWNRVEEHLDAEHDGHGRMECEG